jgi:competence protein ComEC
LRTARHVMVYDTGPRLASGRDAGTSVVVPYLHALGTRHLDLLVLSHADSDHSGGAAAVLAEFPPRDQIAGGDSVTSCRAGRGYHWDGVDIEVIGPAAPAAGNDGSCVLQIRGARGGVLLTGDMSQRAELELLRAGSLEPCEVVIVPHHGSRSSSSAAFIAAVRPRYAIVSAGHLNRFGFPKPEVISRWQRAGTLVRNTDIEGALTVTVRRSQPLQLGPGERLDQHRFWTLD